ncbi:collagen alpha-6(VI) chain-like [Egretta garzetta]|uniref:collagen alpha-6(VI) chain-like n=1 Tax=Egretta garzetta TaxID=188379 RepID=UPI00051F0E8D|nr:collagen alpha-6(VI) chain-like [Egretta garzetta]
MQRASPYREDIVLLVDSSDTMEPSSLPYVKNFTIRMIEGLPIGPNQFRLALAQYSDDLSTEFMLDTYRRKGPMVNHIRDDFALRGGSAVHIGNALNAAYETFFQKSAGEKEKQQIIVILTSAPSEDDVGEAARSLKSHGVKIIAIGTKEAPYNDLLEMATPPFHYINPVIEELPKFSEHMPQIIDDIIQANISDIINIPDYNDSAVQEVCDGDTVADIVYIVDRGTSKSNFEELKKFLQNLTSSFDVKEKCIRIGLVIYTDGQEVVSHLNRDTNKAEILQIIQELSAGSGEAKTGAAINVTRLKLFAEGAGSRKKQGVEQIAVLVTHRPSQDNVSDVATLLRRSGVTVFAVGVEDASDQQLVQIASYPQEQYVTSLRVFSDLQRQNTIFRKKVLNKIQNKLYVDSERKEILKTGCLDTEAADIYLLVDGSSSLDYRDFMDVKTFLKEMIRLFDIGINKVRFGLVQFSHFNEPEFELNKYTSASDLIKGIENIRQIGGNTSTGGALAYMKPLFEKARSQRGVRVPCHLIVLTDGESQDSVKEPAMKLREDQVNIYAIGVREANITQLYEIAGVKNRVYFVHDFDLLQDIKNEVVQEICTIEVCKEVKADVVFLVDSSASIGNEHFLKIKNFMRELVNGSDVGADRVRIGVVQFSHKPKEEFKLSTYSTKRDILRAIDRISPLQSTRLTGGALKFMLKYFEDSSGSRDAVKKILILITGGESQDEVKVPATLLRNTGVIIYSVGVLNADKTQLEEISGKREMVFYGENSDILSQTKKDLMFYICSSPPDDKCRRVERLDIVFVMDSSGSISPSQYQAMKDFMIALVKQSDVGPDGVQFGALKYSDDPVVLFYLNKYTTKLEITEAIQRDDPLGQRTYTAKALFHSEMFFTEEHGSRKSKGVPQVIIVITDGESHDKDKLDDSAQRLRNKGITIYAVGVEGAKRNELLIMAGSEDKCFYVDTFEGLGNLTANITNDICNISVPDCPKKADVMLLMDGSRSIDEENFRIMIDFVTSLINPAVIVQNTKIGFAVYGGVYKEEFSLSFFPNRSELEFKIQSIKQIKGRQSNIVNALEKVKHNFQPEKGSRIHENVQQILLVIIAGRTSSRAARAAESLRKKGVDIYAIGVGNVDQSQLTQITGSPSRKYAVDDFSNLKNIKKRLVDVICEDDNRKVACFVDITVGFDISSQREGQHLFHGQTRLEKHFPEILQALLSLRDVSCNVGSKAQSSVALKVKNTVTPIPTKFYVDSESVLRNLSEAVIKTPSQLNVEFLQSLWETFRNKDETRQKVLLVFSDGVDDDLEALEEKSEELKKKGLDALITVALEGASNFQNLQSIEFGKGFEYGTHLDIGMTDIASRLSKILNNIAEKTCCCLSCKCTGEEGEIGDRGKGGIKERYQTLSGQILSLVYIKSHDLEKGPNGVKGNLGYLGDEGEPGFRGFVGEKVQYNSRQSEFLSTGENGEDGSDGIRGEEGSPGPRGPPGDRGQKGLRGYPGNPGLNSAIPGTRGFAGEEGQEGERGQKGSRGPSGGVGNPGNRGQPGQYGLQGKQGYRGPQGQKGINGQKGQKGRPGRKGPPGEAGDEGIAGERGLKGYRGRMPCELIDYVRKKSPCWDGKVKCPVYPTELVFALDTSRTLTPDVFELMREIMMAIVSDARIRESNCPVGARVAVLSYNSVTHQLIRFSEFHNKNKLLNALKNISYQSSSSERNIGSAMRFIARNIFKRTLQGPNVRKIAVVFSHGPAADASSVKQAVLEMSAVGVIPVVIAFEDTPHISQAFLMDDSGLFQVLNVRGTEYKEVSQRFHLCTLCYDKCKPDAFCERPRRRLLKEYVDAAFILDSSQKMSGAEFEQVKDFMSKAVTAFNISSDPKTSVVGDRIALVSHALPDFKAGIGKRPVKKEFDFVTYSNEDLMRIYIKESLQQLNGEAAVGHAMQWTIANIFSGAPNPRPRKVIIIISAGKTSQWDKGTLKKISLQAKCRGYAVLVISLGKSYDRNELEELASTPLEQHLVQLGRIHKPELDYVMKFLKPFIRFLRSEDNYPPEELKANCSMLRIQNQKPVFEIEDMIADRATIEAASFIPSWHSRGLRHSDRKHTPLKARVFTKKKQKLSEI